MKKLLALMIVLATVLSVVPVTVFAADANSAKVEGFSLSVNDGDIDLNFYLTLTDEVIADETAKVKFTTARGEVQEIPVKNGIKTVVDTSNFYKFTAKRSSVEMAENVKMELISGGNAIAINGGATYYEYSVKAYAEQLLNDATYGKLVKAMLNYGAYAQKYFAAKNETPLGTLANANCAYTTELDAVAADISAVTVAGTVQAGAKASLILDSDTSIVVYDKDGNKIGEKKGINSLNLDTAYEIDCGTHGKVTVSVLAVGEAVLAKSANADYKNLIKALKLYSDVSLEFAPIVYIDMDYDDLDYSGDSPIWVGNDTTGNYAKEKDTVNNIYYNASGKTNSYFEAVKPVGEEAFLRWYRTANTDPNIRISTTERTENKDQTFASMPAYSNDCVSVTITLAADDLDGCEVLPVHFRFMSNNTITTDSKTGKLVPLKVDKNGKVTLAGGSQAYVLADLKEDGKTTFRFTVDFKNATITAYDENGSIIVTDIIDIPSKLQEGKTMLDFKNASDSTYLYPYAETCDTKKRSIRIYDIRIESGNAFGG